MSNQIKVGDIVKNRLTSYSKHDKIGIVLDVVNEGQDILTLLQNGARFVDRKVHFKKL